MKVIVSLPDSPVMLAVKSERRPLPPLPVTVAVNWSFPDPRLEARSRSERRFPALIVTRSLPDPTFAVICLGEPATRFARL